MTVLLLARHGETDWTREKRWQGHGDPPLNERGRAQARALAAELAEVRIDAIYSSDLQRASQTAPIVAADRGLEPVLDAELRENDFGGESYQEMAERAFCAAAAVATSHPRGRVLVVTHNGPIRAIHAHAVGVPYPEYRQAARSIKKGSVSA